MESNDVLFPSLFEDDYITRSLGPIVNQPDVALTELVANAWDAGASHVRIFIPDSINNTLVVEDDGIGMNEEEFQNHWMKLRYNRRVSNVSCDCRKSPLLNRLKICGLALKKLPKNLVI